MLQRTRWCAREDLSPGKANRSEQVLGRFYCTLSPFEGFKKHCHISTLKGTTKGTTEDVLKLNTLRGTKTAFLNPKRYDEHPRHFYMVTFIWEYPPGIMCTTLTFSRTLQGARGSPFRETTSKTASGPPTNDKSLGKDIGQPRRNRHLGCPAATIKERGVFCQPRSNVSGSFSFYIIRIYTRRRGNVNKDI